MKNVLNRLITKRLLCFALILTIVLTLCVSPLARAANAAPAISSVSMTHNGSTLYSGDTVKVTIKTTNFESINVVEAVIKKKNTGDCYATSLDHVSGTNSYEGIFDITLYPNGEYVLDSINYAETDYALPHTYYPSGFSFTIKGNDGIIDQMVKNVVMEYDGGTLETGKKVKITAQADNTNVSSIVLTLSGKNYSMTYNSSTRLWEATVTLTEFYWSPEVFCISYLAKDRSGHTEDALVYPTPKIPLAIRQHPSNVNAKANTTVSLSVAATGSYIRFQWQYLAPGGTWTNSPANGNTTDTLIVPVTPDRNGFQYRCVITDALGNNVTTNAATLTVSDRLNITQQPTNQFSANGGTAKFTVAANGDGLGYQWQYLAPGRSWTNSPATGNTTSSLSVPATTDRNGYQYRCIVSDKYGSKVTSDTATLTVSMPKITTQPSNQTGGGGNLVKFNVNASGEGLVYQWQYLAPGGNWTNSPAAGNTTSSLSVPATVDRNGFQYRCAVTDKYGNKVISNTATLTVSVPKIIAQPASQTGGNGTIIKFYVTASGSGLVYQWQYLAPGGNWTNSPATGNTTSVLSVPVTADRNGFQYRCVVTDKYGNTVASNAATLTVSTPKITTQPTNQSVVGGNTAKFSVSASGDGLLYQWQYLAPGGSWVNSPATGNTTASLSVPATADRNGFQYRCIVSDKYGSKVTSSSAKLTVSSLKITAHPTNQSGSNGTTVKFTVSASGEGLLYQWQYLAPGRSWTNSPATGSTTASLTVPATKDRDGYQYHCVVSDRNGAMVTSNAATLKVTPAILTITAQPQSQTNGNGNIVKFSVTATGDGLNYCWQYKTQYGSWRNSTDTGNTTATLSVSAVSDNNKRSYRCIVTDEYGKSVTSDAATLTIATLKISSNPSAKTATNGSTVTFSVTASGDGLGYQWQYLTPNGTWTKSPASGCTTATLTIPATNDRNGYQYRCVVTDQYGNVATSTAAKLTVTNPKISTQPSDKSASEGKTAKFSISASGDGLTYQWQYLAPGGSWTNSPATGCTTASLSVPVTADRNGFKYRCVVTDKYGNKVTSNAATLTVSSSSAW